LPDAWRFAFFGGSVSGAIILGLSGTLTGAASAACGATLDPNAAVIADEDAAATLTFALAVVAAVAGAGAGAELLADNDVADVNGAGADGAGAADAVGTSAGVAVATVEGGAAGGGLTACGCAWIARAVVRAEALGMSAGGGALAVIGAGAGTALTAIAGELTAAVLTVGATDGTAVSRTLVTIARAAIGVFCAPAGRSTSDRTTPAPAVAPIAVATRTTRTVRAKLGAGAK
jgi:hypothetical protein